MLSFYTCTESWIMHPDLTPDLVDKLLVRFVRDYEKWTVQEVDRVTYFSPIGTAGYPTQLWSS